jgi:photosystem II stability/assembly factor-like uncharacterized protein
MLTRFISKPLIFVVAITVSGTAVASEWQISGPKGGDLLELSVAGDDIWVADRNFLYVSRGGSSWERVTVRVGGRALYALEALSVDPRNPNRIAVGGVLFPNLRLTAITTDGGRHWFFPAALAELGAKEVTPVAFTGDESGTLYVRVDTSGCQYFKGGSFTPSPFEIAGLYRSSGDLQTWTHVRQACTGDVTIDLANPDVLYIQRSPTFGGNLVSRDRGATWQTWETLHPSDLIADRHASATRYATAGDGFVNLVMSSPDGGHTWALLGDGLRTPLNAPIRIAQQSDGRIVAVSREGVFLFEGSVWTRIDTPFRSGWEVTAPENGEMLLVASERGLYRGTTATGWTLLETGHVGTEIWSVATDPTDASLVYASTSDIFSLQPGRIHRSFDRGRTWEELDLPGIPEDGRFHLTVDGAGTLYALRAPMIGSGSAIYRLRKGEHSWQKLTMPGNRFIAATATGETVYSMQHEAIVLSTNGAEFWVVFRPPSSRSFHDLTITGMNEEVIVGARSDGVFRSTDRGESWEKTLDLSAWSVESARSDRSIVYAIANDTPQHSDLRELYRSDDYGLTWRRMADLPAGRFAMSVAAGQVPLAIDPVDAMTLYVATRPNDATLHGGWVYRSRDGGASWERFDAGLEPLDREVGALAVSADGTTVFAATSNGVRRLSLDGTIDPDPEPDPVPQRRRGVSRRP